MTVQQGACVNCGTAWDSVALLRAQQAEIAALERFIGQMNSELGLLKFRDEEQQAEIEQLRPVVREVASSKCWRPEWCDSPENACIGCKARVALQGRTA